MGKKQGYAITTYCLRLRCNHPEWLEETQKFYNRIQKFYYDLYLKHSELWNENSQNALRGLEILSIPGRKREVVEEPLPWKEALLYFRRAAANAGIAAAKSYLARTEVKEYVGMTETFHSAVTYYKGMYQELTENSIELRVWTGMEWRWMHCRLSGRSIPQEAKIMSPSVVFEKPYVMLHIPIKEIVQDASSVKERIAEGRNICGIQFGNRNIFAVASVMNAEKKEVAVHFFKGGNEYTHRYLNIIEHIEKSYASHGKNGEGQINRKYWMKLKHLNNDYAHRVSRELVDFCKKKEVGIIVFPKYLEEYEKNVKKGSGNYSALHLSTKIKEYITYKAWQEGILVIDVQAKDTQKICAVCGGEIVEKDKTRQESICVNGHRSNQYLNVARNISKKCLKQFQKKKN